uniref:Uncharacterized protein n=1 Tax=Anguilla anguilla TaxID=7936 RepID=A0A0E9Q811_ANGAN
MLVEMLAGMLAGMLAEMLAGMLAEMLAVMAVFRSLPPQSTADHVGSHGGLSSFESDVAGVAVELLVPYSDLGARL